jgi:hypothetical protein
MFAGLEGGFRLGELADYGFDDPRHFAIRPALVTFAPRAGNPTLPPNPGHIQTARPDLAGASSPARHSALWRNAAIHKKCSRKNCATHGPSATSA